MSHTLQLAVTRRYCYRVRGFGVLSGIAEVKYRLVRYCNRHLRSLTCHTGHSLQSLQSWSWCNTSLDVSHQTAIRTYRVEERSRELELYQSCKSALYLKFAVGQRKRILLGFPDWPIPVVFFYVTTGTPRTSLVEITAHRWHDNPVDQVHSLGRAFYRPRCVDTDCRKHPLV